jgi:hypothetical protein
MNEDPDYMIYVSTQEGTPPETFRDYCEEVEHGCAYMTPEV